MNWQSLLTKAVGLHQAGDLAQAERLYNQVLATNRTSYPALYHLAFLLYQQQNPDAALQTIDAALAFQPTATEALALRSVLLLGAGRLEEAAAGIAKVTAREPGNADAWHNQGVILSELRRYHEALASFDRALALKPAMSTALYRRAVALMEVKRHLEAIAAFDAALAQDPNILDAWANRGLTLYEIERYEEALACFDRATKLDPHYPLAWTNRGKALDKLGRFDEALGSYDKALTISPNNANAWFARAATLRTVQRFESALEAVNNAIAQGSAISPALELRGWLLCELGRIADGLAEIQRAAENSLRSSTSMESNPPEHKQRHDAEQRAYLAQHGVVLHAGAYHLADGQRLATPAVSAAAVQTAVPQWSTREPRIAVVDDFLTPAALEKLRAFCWGSTVWRMSYAGGYLGAMAEHGFASPLLAQIAEELRDALPGIIGGHALRKVWGYKYDSRLHGIGVHADQAAVNVNFWITPSEANRNPARGGMVIWSEAAPKDWNFKSYNGDIAAVREFLSRTGANAVTVPYRSNRAVIFDSDLFHETDTIDFEEGYLNRRINVTMLFGRRTHFGT